MFLLSADQAIMTSRALRSSATGAFGSLTDIVGEKPIERWCEVVSLAR